MIQLSLGVNDVTPDACPSVPVPLLRTAMPWGTRVTGVWSGDLAAARRQLADWVHSLPPETTVRDLFTGRFASASEEARRLEAPPTVSHVFVARHTMLAGKTWARLFGTYALAEPDIVVAADPDVDVARLYELLTRWAGFRLEAPRDARPADDTRPIPYGHWLLGTTGSDVADATFWAALRERFEAAYLKDAFDARMSAPAPRVIIEADRMDLPEPSAWLVGATRALRAVTAQRATLERAGLDPQAHARFSPHAHDAAGFCDRLGDLQHVDALFAYREDPQSDLDSGWRFACLDPAHVHDERALLLAPLGRVTTRFPEFVNYFALPPGWVVTHEDDAYWLTAPGDERAFRDEPPRTP